MTAFELLPEGSTRRERDSEPLEWPHWGGSTSSVTSELGAWLTDLGTVPGPAIDLVRIAAGAYLADRRTRRGAGFSRSIDLHVQLTNSKPWRTLVDDVARLLSWLTGDHWALEISDDGYYIPEPEVLDSAPVDTVALLSGGLDSFSGAILSGAPSRLYLGHWDSPTTKGAQNAVHRGLNRCLGQRIEYRQIKITNTNTKKEASSRTRSLLFLALATAAAAARHARVVEVPENGYTSLNPPLGPERGGALSTRSTHPTTFARFNRLIEALGLDITVHDPYAELTKGQLVQRAAETGLDGFIDAASTTLSCGKLDGGRYRGGNPNQHCGLCYPCIVRRAAFIAADVDDRTIYLSGRLHGKALRKLLQNRASDITAVRRAAHEGYDILTVLTLGPFPADFDLDRAVALCATGLAELARVPLP